MKISQEVLNILEICRIEDNLLFLPDYQLDRKLYLAVNKVLECLGGKWNRKAKAHIFNKDIGDILDTAILTGEVTDIIKELQYFPTPESVIMEMRDKIYLHKTDIPLRVLEPSAGKGSIAKFLFRYGAVDCCEIHEEFHKSLLDIGCNIVATDFLKYIPGFKYDLIVANPPFTRQQDIDHVNHMIDLCCGSLVSVMSAGVLFRENRKTKEFRDRIGFLNGSFYPLPEESFKKSGTMINTCIVVINGLAYK